MNFFVSIDGWLYLVAFYCWCCCCCWLLLSWLLLVFLSRQMLHSISICIFLVVMVFSGGEIDRCQKICMYAVVVVVVIDLLENMQQTHTHTHTHTYIIYMRFNAIKIVRGKKIDTYKMVWNAIMWIENVIESRKKWRKTKKTSNNIINNKQV